MNISWEEFARFYEQLDDTIKEQIDLALESSKPEITETSAIDLWLENLKKLKGDQDDSKQRNAVLHRV